MNSSQCPEFSFENGQQNNFGVDLNRNYDYKFGFDDNRSSLNSNPCSVVFHGNAPFSESET